MAEFPVTMIVLLDNTERWRVNIDTHEEQQHYAGIIAAYDICGDIYFFNKKRLSYNIVGPARPIDIWTFLNKAGANLIAGERDFPVTEPLDWTLINKFDEIAAPKSLGWWTHYNSLGQTDRQEFALLRFESEHFIQGFIEGCNAFNVDFRNVVIGLPFEHLEDGTIRYFDVVGYGIQQPPDMIKHIAKVPFKGPAKRYFV